MKMKEIKQFCKQNNISFRYEENNKIWINACQVGDNFYDYGEEETPLTIDDNFACLANDDRIIFLRCDECCCAG